jgi:NAD(P)-dependent dehydrogenase (short-subunit alcohol dehydrogenase family)
MDAHACIQVAARQVGIPRDAFTYIQCDLASLESVRKFVDDFRATGRTLDALVCNAAVYLPVDPEPSFTVEGSPTFSFLNSRNPSTSGVAPLLFCE